MAIRRPNRQQRVAGAWYVRDPDAQECTDVMLGGAVLKKQNADENHCRFHRRGLITEGDNEPKAVITYLRLAWIANTRVVLCLSIASLLVLD